MAEIGTVTIEETFEFEAPDVSQLITEDDTPVDNLFSEKQQRLLVESLYASWRGTFLATANVALYYAVHQPAVVPDVLLSLDVETPEDWYAKNKRSYFVWEFGKVPDVVIEIVSNRKGEEEGHKLETYARIGVDYYVILDPTQQLSKVVLRAYERRGHTYRFLERAWFDEIQLGVQLWEGKYEDKHATWLRWYEREGQLLLTGVERAEQERQRAEQERQRAEQEHQRAEQERQHAEQERQRAERLAAQLRALGIEPE